MKQNEDLILTTLQSTHLELYQYISTAKTKYQQCLYREGYLYIRLALEYIVETLVNVYNVPLVENLYNNQIEYHNTYTLIMSLCEANVIDTTQERMLNDIRMIVNNALHRGTSNTYLEHNWEMRFKNLIILSSLLIDDELGSSSSLYSDMDFLHDMSNAFGENELQHNKLLQDASKLFLQNVKLTTLDSSFAQDLSNYYIQSLKNGTSPILALSHCLKRL